MAIAEQRLTLDEFLKLPETKPASEFFDGMVKQKVSPQGVHSMLQTGLVGHINGFAKQLGLAFAFTELRVRFGGEAPVPDISVFRWDRIPVDDAGRVLEEFREPPDIAIEIVSPGQSVNALVRRCLWYVENGVRIALVVDPHDESVILFRPDHTVIGLSEDDSIDLENVLPGFRMTVSELFGLLRVR